MKKILLTTVYLLACGIIGYSQGTVTKNHIYSSVLGINSDPVLFNDVSLNSYELISSSIQFSESNNVQKVLFLPLKLVDGVGNGYLENIKINFAQKGGATTIGFGIGYDHASPFNSRAEKIWQRIYVPDEKDSTDFSSKDKFEEYIKLVSDTLRNSYLTLYEELVRNSFKIGLGYNVSLFQIIGGDDVDLDMNGLIDNFYATNKQTFTLNGNYTFSDALSVSGAIYLLDQRYSSEEGSEFVPFNGWTVNLAFRIASLNKNYRQSKDYFESLFIPAIIGGGLLKS